MGYPKLLDNFHTYFTYKDEHGFIHVNNYKLESIDDSYFNGELMREGVADKFGGNISFSRAIYKHLIQVRRYMDNNQLPPLDVFKRICLLLQIDPINLLNLRVIEVSGHEDTNSRNR